MEPSGRTAIFAPGLRGVEPRLAATVAIRQRENSFRSKYERYVRKDPNDADLCRKARTAVAAKMARVAHALIKQGVDYRGYHEAAIPGVGTSLHGP